MDADRDEIDYFASGFEFFKGRFLSLRFLLLLFYV